MSIKNYFHGWSRFEITLLILAIIVPVGLGAFFQSSPIQVGASSLTVITAILFAKARIEGFFVSFMAIILFSIVAWGERLYGEVGVQIIFGLPMLVVGFISWRKARIRGEDTGNAEIEIRKTSLKEMGILLSICAVLGVGVYFLLRAVNTNLLVLSTLSVVAVVFAAVLMTRRSHLGTLGFAVNDAVNILLWLTIVLRGDLTAIVMIVNPALLLLNNTYGIFLWRKMYRDQERKRQHSIKMLLDKPVVIGG